MYNLNIKSHYKCIHTSTELLPGGKFTLVLSKSTSLSNVSKTFSIPAPETIQTYK